MIHQADGALALPCARVTVMLLFLTDTGFALWSLLAGDQGKQHDGLCLGTGRHVHLALGLLLAVLMTLCLWLSWQCLYMAPEAHEYVTGKLLSTAWHPSPSR
jgi:hypothetical protein